MPVFNLTIDDVSPLIVYDGVWSDSSHSDAAWPSYFDGTFHATQQLNAKASLTFQGSAVYLFGAFRINHDMYTTTLDGQATSKDGQSDNSLFQQNMFSAAGLDPSKQHQLTLQNTFRSVAAPYVDLDYIVVTAGDGNAATQSHDSTLDDGDKSIQYSSGWSTSQQQDYFDSTMHRTNGPNNSASISFHGNAISVYGGTAPDHGLFSVSLDGGPATIFNGSAPVQRSQVLLYWAGGLSDDPHKLTITNVDMNGGWLDLDKVVVSDWSGSGSTSSASSVSSASPSATPAPPAGASQSSTASKSSLAGASSAASSTATSLSSSEIFSSTIRNSTSVFSGVVSGSAVAIGADPSSLSGSSMSTSGGSSPTVAVSGKDLNNPSSHHGSRVGAIVGGTIGGILLLALLAASIGFYLRRRTKSTTIYSFRPPSKRSTFEGLRESQPPPRRVPTPAAIPVVREVAEFRDDIPPVPNRQGFERSLPGEPGSRPYDVSILAELAHIPQTENYARTPPAFRDLLRSGTPPPNYSQLSAGGRRRAASGEYTLRSKQG